MFVARWRTYCARDKVPRARSCRIYLIENAAWPNDNAPLRLHGAAVIIKSALSTPNARIALLVITLARNMLMLNMRIKCANEKNFIAIESTHEFRGGKTEFYTSD